MIGIVPERTVSAPAAPAAAGLDGEALETLVSRILVNTPESGSPEVRLRLSDNVLSGTEISIVRDPSGHLAVALVTKDPAAFQTLVAARGELLSGLEKTEAGTVSVEVRNESGNDEGDMRRRSRGLEEAGEDRKGYIR